MNVPAVFSLLSFLFPFPLSFLNVNSTKKLGLRKKSKALFLNDVIIWTIMATKRMGGNKK